MKTSSKTLRICARGHKYYKSSDCPVCPVCEKERKPSSDFLTKISAPARRALEREGIDSLHKLSRYSEEKLLTMHGRGPGSIPKLRSALREKGLSFRKNDCIAGVGPIMRVFATQLNMNNFIPSFFFTRSALKKIFFILVIIPHDLY